MLADGDAGLHLISALTVLGNGVQLSILQHKLGLDSEQFVDVRFEPSGGFHERLLILPPVEVGPIKQVVMVAFLQLQLFVCVEQLDLSLPDGFVSSVQLFLLLNCIESKCT